MVSHAISEYNGLHEDASLWGNGLRKMDGINSICLRVAESRLRMFLRQKRESFVECFNAWKIKKLWMLCGSENFGSSSKTWCGGKYLEQAGENSGVEKRIYDLASHIESMQESQSTILSKIRWARNICMRKMERFQEFYGRHGSSPQFGIFHRADRQRRQLRAIQLQVGYSFRTRQKSTPQEAPFNWSSYKKKGILFSTRAAIAAIGKAILIFPVAAQTASLIMTVQSSSNNNSTGIVATPVRKQLGNFGTGCTSGTPTPSPAGQLWATAAIQSTYSGVGGCPVQGIPTVTASGTGILAVDNGHGAGGTDSATAITDTYGGSSQDSACTGDTHHNDATLFSGLSAAPCVTNGTALFGMSTAASFGNADMLWPSFYGTVSSTALDAATNYYDDVYFIVPDHTNLHALENDVGIVSSPNSYLGSSKSEMVWGTQYSWTANMWQGCPQNCSAFHTFKFCLASNPSSCITTLSLTDGDAYRMQWYGSRTSVSSTYCYNDIVVYDVTAGGTPTHYLLYDNTNGLVMCGSPINQPTFASGAYVQNQADMTVANASTSFYIISRTTQYFSLSGVSGINGFFGFGIF